MTIWLVRHGQSAYNAHSLRHRREDVPLSTLGIQQAAAITVTGSPAIVTSPLQRAYATGCIIAATHGLAAPEIAWELTERDWDQTCDEAAEIAAKFLETLDGDVLAVTHAGVLKGLLGLAETPTNGSVHRWR